MLEKPTFGRYAAIPEIDNVLVGAMGIRPVRDVDLIRQCLCSSGPPASRRWRRTARTPSEFEQPTYAGWHMGECCLGDSINRRHGFELVPDQQKTPLLKTYWTVPKRQIEASVVLANRRSK